MSLDFIAIGQRLKFARLNRKLTQEQLAEKLDVSVAYLSRIERGSINVNLKRLSEICSLLDISEGEILDGVTTTSSNYLNQEFINLFKNCPPDKLKLIYDVAKLIIDRS